MAQRRKADKGYQLEELLRAYFSRAGFFAVRGVPFRHAGDDLTDIDVWLYEKPTGTSRRRQIVDAKSRSKPKAVERLFWTKGLAQLLEVDGAYIATTDTRGMLRGISKKLGISVLDGWDIRRIRESGKVIYPDRLPEEHFIDILRAVDKARRNKDLQQQYHDIKLSLIDNFGTGTINRALDSFSSVSSVAAVAQPESDLAQAAIRLSYFAAAVAAIALDYICSEVSLRVADERRSTLVNAIRYGNVDEAAGLERVRLAVALIQQYAPNGDASARAVNAAVQEDLSHIPVEIIAEHVVKNMKPEDLFQIAKTLEHNAFSNPLKGFDALSINEKAFVGVLLDYCGVDRARFASGARPVAAEPKRSERTTKRKSGDGPLFETKEAKSAVGKS